MNHITVSLILSILLLHTFVKSSSENDEILEQITKHETEWKLSRNLGNNNYEFIFEWNCFCATCLELAKYIQVYDNKIIKIEFSDNYAEQYANTANFELKLPRYGCNELYLHSKHYHNIDALFDILKTSVHPTYYDPKEHIITVIFDKLLHYPKSVSISNDMHHIGWTIKCLTIDSEDHIDSCRNEEGARFWISKEWREIIGWFMIAVFVITSIVRYIIAYLRRRARKKHRDASRNGNASSNNTNANSLRPRIVKKSSNKKTPDYMMKLKQTEQQMKQRINGNNAPPAGIIEEQKNPS